MSNVDAKLRRLAHNERITLPEGYEVMLKSRYSECSENAIQSGIRYGARKNRRAMIIVAAAFLFLFSLTALAYSGIGDSFVSFFNNLTGGALSPNQAQYIENETIGIRQSVTNNGTKITLESALVDDYNIFAVIRIEASDSISLDEKHLNFDVFRLLKDDSVLDVAYRGYFRYIEDNDGRSNTAAMLIQISVVSTSDTVSGFTFRDEAKRLFSAIFKTAISV